MSPLLGGFPISVIPYGLDTEEFAPRPRAAAREVLGIPQDANVVLFVADMTTNHRKGFSVLMEVLSRCREVRNLFLVSLGQNKPSVHLGLPWLHLGAIYHDRTLSMVYSAADVFVLPSSQDNLPNTVLESLACGTPVVGFAIGGIPDMVRPGVTGFLAPPGDTTGLRHSIADALNEPARRNEMALNCRRIAVEEYALESQAR